MTVSQKEPRFLAFGALLKLHINSNCKYSGVLKLQQMAANIASPSQKGSHTPKSASSLRSQRSLGC